jgi:hypothetical protein
MSREPDLPSNVCARSASHSESTLTAQQPRSRRRTARTGVLLALVGRSCQASGAGADQGMIRNTIHTRAWNAVSRCTTRRAWLSRPEDSRHRPVSDQPAKVLRLHLRPALASLPLRQAAWPVPPAAKPRPDDEPVPDVTG